MEIQALNMSLMMQQMMSAALVASTATPGATHSVAPPPVTRPGGIDMLL